MLKKTIILCCILIGLNSCYKYDKPKKPDHLIPKDKMVNILVDLKLIASVTGRDKSVLDSAKVVPDQYIYKKYNVDSLQFAESNAYYAYFMDEYSDIYALAKDSLNKLKAHYKVLLDEEERVKKEKDSLAKLKKELEQIEISPEIETEIVDELEDIELIEPVSDKD